MSGKWTTTRQTLTGVIALTLILSWPALVLAASIRESFEGQTPPATDTPPAGWTFVNPEDQAGSFYEAVDDNGNIVGRVKADVVVNGFYPAGYIASTTSVPAALPFSGTFEMLIEDEGEWSDGVFMMGDIAAGLTGDYYFVKYQDATGTTLCYDSDYPDDSRVIVFDTGVGVGFTTWYKTIFSWEPIEGTTGTFTIEAQLMDGTVVLSGSGELTLPDLVQFGFGSSNDAIRVDNIAIDYQHPGQASDPYPADGDADAPAEALTLTWAGGDYAASHDVYFGGSFEDVNAATTASAEYLGGQTETAYTLDDLDFSTPYYWRVDEVNAAPDEAVFKGDVWSFTSEPLAYPIEHVVATSSAVSAEGAGPENTVNGSGLDADDRHSTETTDMWTAPFGGDEPLTLEFAFDHVYKLHQMLVWNYNVQFESILGFGVSNAIIEYSADGETWASLGAFDLAQGTGDVAYTANTTIDFEGAAAQYVRLTVNSTFAAGDSAGLSEVRFLSIPAHARQPQPADGAVNVSVATDLSWRAGRGAAGHDVYLGTDAAAVALVDTVSDSTLDPGSLDLASTYYWRVDEINEAEAITTWEGQMWSFVTEPYIVVEDFESYDDEDNRIYNTWVDGWVNGTGSMAGHLEAPFAELTTVQSGGQSMPLYFDNTAGSTSETDYTFETPQDWSLYGIKTLVVHLYGDSDNTGGRLYVKINDAVVYCDVVADVLQRGQWIAWPIDLTSVSADLTSVRTLSIGVEDSGASGLVYIDTIALRAEAVQSVEPVVPDDGDPNLAAYYAFEDGVDDNAGNYPLTVSGAPTYIAGMAGQAISLNGVDDHAVYDFATDEIWPAYSVSLWARTETFAQAQYCGLFNNDSAEGDFQIDVDGTDPGNYRHRGTVPSTIMGPVSSEWVHLAASCDGVQTRVYYNGLLVATVEAADTNFGQIGIGGNRGFTYHFAGTIDEVRLYNRPLSDGEVAGLAGLTEAIAAL